MTRSFSLLAVILILVLPGCDGTPTEITGGPLVFEGTIVAEGDAVHSFVITTAGGVRVEMSSLVAEPPVAEGFATTVGVGLGDLDSEGNCIISFSSNMLEGQRLSLGLSEKEYCLRVFDNGTISEDGSRIYSILVARSE